MRDRRIHRVDPVPEEDLKGVVAKICRALGKDPIDALVRGRDVLRAQRESDREQRYREMLEHTRAETMIALWEKLPRSERKRVAERLAQKNGEWGR